VGHVANGRAKGNGDSGAVFHNGEYHLTVRQITTLIESESDLRNRAILRLLAETGIRRSELASLDVTDLIAGQSLIVVRRGKGGKMRMLPLTGPLRREIEQLAEGRQSGPLFVSKAGSRLSVRQINRAVAKSGNRAGIASPNPRHNQITCHLLRHSFARLWKENGGSVETLSKILGHASVKTTLDIYGTESWADVQRNYTRMMVKLHPRTGGQNQRKRSSRKEE